MRHVSCYFSTMRGRLRLGSHYMSFIQLSSSKTLCFWSISRHIGIIKSLMFILVQSHQRINSATTGLHILRLIPSLYCKDIGSTEEPIKTLPGLYSVSTHSYFFAGSSTQVLSLKRPLSPHLGLLLSIFDCSMHPHLRWP